MDNNSYEHNVALRESGRIHSNDEYFKARPQIDNHDRRNVFDAGYDRGWQAAQQQSAGEIAELKASNDNLIAIYARDCQTIDALKADNERLREALKNADEFITNGVEFGYIRMPDESLKGIDSAHDTPKIIREALSATPSQSLQAHNGANHE